jgi:hypothetical protein
MTWVELAMVNWAAADPGRFPGAPNWRYTREWATPEERALDEALEGLTADHDAANQKYELDRTAAEAALATSRQTGDELERLLLTAQGDELVRAVSACLSAFGFHVKDMDAVFPAGQKREDLRVRPPADPWTAITEVRGYKDGAQTNDLLRIGRFAVLYAKDEGRIPEASWYVVNQFKDEAPRSRDQALASTPDDLKTFADAGGLVIDTRDLLRLWLAVQAGSVTSSEAQSRLMGATGRFAFP